MSNLNSALLAYQFMAKHPGRFYALGDFLRLLRQPNGDKLPEGTAIGQRLSTKYKADCLAARKAKKSPYVTRIYLTETKRGAIAEVRYFMTRENAARYLADQAELRRVQRTKEELRRAS